MGFDQQYSSAMTSEPAVSIVVPVYQKEREVLCALHSAKASIEVANIPCEIIAVDDGSKDQSTDLILDWMRSEKSNDLGLRLIRQENGGAAKARNTGWKNAQAPLIAFLDADDIWRPRHLQTVFGLAKKYPNAPLVADKWSEITKSGKVRQHKFGVGTEKEGLLPCFFRTMATGPMVVSSSTAMAPRWALEKSKGFPDGIRLAEDKIAWGRLALLGPVAWSPRIGAVWRKDADNRSDQLVGPAPSGNFRDFLAEAKVRSDLPPSLIEGIHVCHAVESARVAGKIQLYDHGTPDLVASLNISSV